ncbi:hypothetical protein J5Y03_17705 [Bacillus sp. RG28]|uniref:Uncharacterized protein n=1 Tax=Gottfriedia endophytica TaxID=2820819 RepID=A0A940NTU5_9BACI|nr:hypothetical protein [Gottfriedia endophytica]MBP0726997.1 hypothetical protein [Gottfriedia endophytica]
MFNIFEFLGDLVTVISGSKSFPTEEKINENLKQLRKEQWFQELFSEHTKSFLENKQVRLTVGLAKLDKILNNGKRKKDFQETLLILLKKKK